MTPLHSHSSLKQQRAVFNNLFWKTVSDFISEAVFTQNKRCGYNMIITSRENKIFKLAKLLKTAKGRNEKNMFVIEGVRSVRDALLKNADIECIIIKEETPFDMNTKAPVFTFAKKLFDELSDTVTPQGVIALCRIKKKDFSALLKKDNGLIVICEALQDPGNIGTIIRTAHAAQCSGVVLTKGCCDLYNSKIVRATMSGIFSVDVITDIESKTAIKKLKENGYKIAAGALGEGAVDFYDASLYGKWAIVIGNEGNGVTKETLSLCDEILKIPMDSAAESLNAAVAGSIMMYEHYRQNRKKI